jgi:heterodisulfide reductase subunit B2
MKIGLYPGCSLDGSSREYSDSLLQVCEKAGIEIEKIPDWNCCGATAAHNLNHELALALPARNIALAEKAGMTQILVPCAACYSRLSVTLHELKKDAVMKEKISKILDMEFKGDVEIINILEFVEKYLGAHLASTDAINPFAHKVACYYGCLMVRPQKIVNFDRQEDPQIMDNIMKQIGATPIDWPFKTECCGAGLSVSRTESVGRLSGNILIDAVERGAEAIIVACPMCHSNLDMRRPAIDKYLGKKTDIPIMYITQAIGLALGVSKDKLGFDKHFIPVKAELIN